MKPIFSPYTGQALDFDRLPDFDPVAQHPGKHDPVTHRPLDRTALEAWSFTGNDAFQLAEREQIEGAVADVEAQLAAPANGAGAAAALEGRVGSLESRTGSIEARMAGAEAAVAALKPAPPA